MGRHEGTQMDLFVYQEVKYIRKNGLTNNEHRIDAATNEKVGIHCADSRRHFCSSSSFGSSLGS